jgi:hypothetical protein
MHRTPAGGVILAAHDSDIRYIQTSELVAHVPNGRFHQDHHRLNRKGQYWFMAIFQNLHGLMQSRREERSLDSERKPTYPLRHQKGFRTQHWPLMVGGNLYFSRMSFTIKFTE